MTTAVASDAWISSCGAYRYRLSRTWDLERPTCAFVMLNPSTADASKDDPTIRKCVGYAKRWGYGEIVVVNAFAFRATDPSDLKDAEDPFGPENEYALTTTARQPKLDRIVLGWGTKCRWGRGDDKVLGDKRALRCLRQNLPVAQYKKIFALNVTKGGYPQHPLYVPYDVELIPYTETPE